MSTRIQLRRGTAAAWTSANPVLAVGEPGLETDTGFQKIGDGSTAWASLAYANALPASVVTGSSLESVTVAYAVLHGPLGYAASDGHYTTLALATQHLGDGSGTLLSAVYSSLGAAQVVYPLVTSLTTTVDQAAIQAAIAVLPVYASAQTPSGGIVDIGAGAWIVNSGSRTDATCGIATGTSVVTDASCVAGDVGSVIDDTQLTAIGGPGVRIVSVNPGVSFTVTGASNATTSKSLTLLKPAITIPVGVWVRGHGSVTATGSAGINYVNLGSTTLIQDNGTGITVCPQVGYDEGHTAVRTRLSDCSIWGNSANWYGYYAAQIWYVQAERCDFSNHGRWGVFLAGNVVAARFQDCSANSNGSVGISTFLSGGYYFAEEGSTGTDSVIFDACLSNKNFGWGFYGNGTLRECQIAVTQATSYTDPATTTSGISLAIVGGSGSPSYVRGLECESSTNGTYNVWLTQPTIFEACSFAGPHWQVRVNASGQIFDNCLFNHNAGSGAMLSASPNYSIAWRTCSFAGGSDAFISVAGGVQVPAVEAANTGQVGATFSSGSTQTTLNGTSAGTAVSTQPYTGPSYKKMLVFLSGYENTTGAAQTITFPVAFANAPLIANQPAAFGATASTTVLTLPISMGAPVTGWIVVEGF